MSASETGHANKPEQPGNVLSDYYEGYRQLELESLENRIRKARNAIYAVAILNIIGSLIFMGASDSFSTEGLVIVFLVSGIFFGLGFYTKKQPLAAIIIALVLYIGLWILDIIVAGPEMLYKGILVKAIIIYFLVTGIKHAREAEQIKKEMNK
jgi:hypothetical protein